MKTYQLNKTGEQGVIDALVKYTGTTEEVLNNSYYSGQETPLQHWCQKAEQGVGEYFNGSISSFEIPSRYTLSGRPEVVDCPEDWFDCEDDGEDE